jgi:hypothetical protein
MPLFGSKHRIYRSRGFLAAAMIFAMLGLTFVASGEDEDKVATGTEGGTGAPKENVGEVEDSKKKVDAVLEYAKKFYKQAEFLYGENAGDIKKERERSLETIRLVLDKRKTILSLGTGGKPLELKEDLTNLTEILEELKELKRDHDSNLSNSDRMTDEEMKKTRELRALMDLMESVARWEKVAVLLKERSERLLTELEKLKNMIEERNSEDDKFNALSDEIVEINKTLSLLSGDIVKKDGWKTGKENIKKSMDDHATENQKQLASLPEKIRQVHQISLEEIEKKLAPLSKKSGLIWLAVMGIVILIAIVVSSVWILNQTTRLRKDTARLHRDQVDFKRDLKEIRDQRLEHRDGLTPAINAGAVGPDSRRQYEEKIAELEQSLVNLQTSGDALADKIADRDSELKTVKGDKNEVEEKLQTTTAQLTEARSTYAKIHKEIEALRTKYDLEVFNCLNEALGGDTEISRPVFYLCLTLKSDRDLLGDTEDDERKRFLRGTFKRLDESIFLEYQDDPNQLGTVRDAVARTVNELLLKGLYTCEWPKPGAAYDPDLHHAENEAGNRVAAARTAILKSAHDDRVISKARVTTER